MGSREAFLFFWGGKALEGRPFNGMVVVFFLFLFDKACFQMAGAGHGKNKTEH